MSWVPGVVARRRNPSQPGETAGEDVANALQVLQTLEWQHGQPVLSVEQYNAMFSRLKTALQKIRSQGHGSYRRNPYLYVYNPPLRGRGLEVGGKATLHIRIVGLIAVELHDIRYTHAEDGKPYEHTFETKTRAWAGVEDGKNVVVLRGEGNAWEDR